MRAAPRSAQRRHVSGNRLSASQIESLVPILFRKRPAETSHPSRSGTSFLCHPGIGGGDHAPSDWSLRESARREAEG